MLPERQWLGVGWAPWRGGGYFPPFQCIPAPPPLSLLIHSRDDRNAERRGAGAMGRAARVARGGRSQTGKPFGVASRGHRHQALTAAHRRPCRDGVSWARLALTPPPPPERRHPFCRLCGHLEAQRGPLLRRPVSNLHLHLFSYMFGNPPYNCTTNPPHIPPPPNNHRLEAHFRKTQTKWGRGKLACARGVGVGEGHGCHLKEGGGGGGMFGPN